MARRGRFSATNYFISTQIVGHNLILWRCMTSVPPSQSGTVVREPTVVTTLRSLEEGLEDFPGCAVIISHDRWFLDRVATHVLAFEGDSQVRWFEGNFTEYEEYKKKVLGEDVDQPHRIKYKKLA